MLSHEVARWSVSLCQRNLMLSLNANVKPVAAVVLVWN